MCQPCILGFEITSSGEAINKACLRCEQVGFLHILPEKGFIPFTLKLSFYGWFIAEFTQVTAIMRASGLIARPFAKNGKGIAATVSACDRSVTHRKEAWRSSTALRRTLKRAKNTGI